MGMFSCDFGYFANKFKGVQISIVRSYSIYICSSSPSSWAHRWISPCLGEPRVVGFRGTLGDYILGEGAGGT
jgi:hypothetical protein